MFDAAHILPRPWITRHCYAALVLSMLAILLIPLRPAVITPAAHAEPQLLQLATQQPNRLVNVIVQQVAPQVGLSKLVAELGGTLIRDLPLIKGFAAQLPAHAIPELARAQGVKWVSLDAPMQSASTNAAPAPQTTGNLLVNPGFEDYLAGWSPMSTTTTYSTEARSGTKAAYANNYGGVYRIAQALPDQQFTFSVWAKAGSSQYPFTNAILSLEFKSTSGQSLAYVSTPIINSSTYQLASVNGTAPVGAATVTVMVMAYSGSELWFDDLSLTSSLAPNASQMVCANNFQVNGSFESGLAGWNWGYAAPTGEAHTGTSAVELTGGYGHVRTMDFGVWPDQLFTFSFWAKANDPIIGGTATIEFINSSGDTIGSTALRIRSEIYARHEISSTAPPGTAWFRAKIQNDAWFGKSLIVDDVCLSLAAYTTPSTSCAGNLAANNGFEADLTGWTSWGQVAIGSTAQSGVKAVQIGAAAGGITQNLPATGDQQFTLTAWGKSNDPSARIGLSFLSATGAQIGLDTYAALNSTSYVPTTIAATAPAGTAQVQISAVKENGPGALWIDDICLTSSTALRLPENPTSVVNGLTYAYYEGGWSKLPDFATLTPLKTGVAPSITIEPRDQADNFAFTYSGYLDVPTDGTYTFSTTSDAGSKLYIGNTVVLINDAGSTYATVDPNAYPVQEVSGSIRLRAGKHAFRVEYFESTGPEQLIVQYAGPGIAKQAIPASAFFRGTDTLGGGGINREYWLNAAGSTVADIPLTSSPSGVDILTKLEGPINWNDTYGARFRGYVIPPASGSYTFWVAGDDTAELWLSTNANSANKTRIGYVSGSTASRAWDTYTTQKSAALSLVAGRRYYIEVLHKDGTGGDNVSVAWQGAGIAARDVIAGQYLLPYLNTASTPSAISTTNLKNVFNTAVRAPDVWNAGPRYLQGQGMTALVVDSGIMPNSDLGSRYLGSLNFVSGEQQGADRYGHGTFVANMIAADGAKSGGQYIGIAPRANVLSFRVNNNLGQGTESDVVAALQWAFDNRQVHNIRVVNISLNSSVASSYTNSPLCAAVEMLWFSGVTVVVAAGNNGTSTLYPPANDPFVITVGATDDKGTPGIADDTVASFSAWGTAESGLTKPEIVAPGRNIVSYLPVTSDLNMSVNRPGNRIGTDYFRMSGTSVAAPIVAGAALLLLQDEPTLTPDQVKLRLTATAVRGDRWAGYDPNKAGAGYLDVYAAVNGTTTDAFPTLIRPAPALQQVFGALWDSTNWQGTTADQVNWNSVNWNSVNWNSVNWNSVNWNSVNWNSVNWNSVNWNSVNWNSVNWNSDYWEGPLGSGQILREWWAGIGGMALTDLTGNAAYPYRPSGSALLTSFEAPSNWADSYGTRVRGYLHVPVTGQYTFWIAGDDTARLLLSTDANPANAGQIASLPGWTNPREWGKYSAQQSVAITLQAGQRYYIEALQKEGGGGDNLAVAWQIPGGARAVIDGAYLSPYQTIGVVEANRTYRLVAQTGNNLCLDILNASLAENAPVQQWGCNTSGAQAFQLTAVAGKTGVYTIRNQNSGKCLDIAGAALTNLAGAVQVSCGSGLSQQWKLIDQGNNVYQLIAQHSGKCLDVLYGAATAGTKIQQYTCNTTVAQRFRLVIF